MKFKKLVAILLVTISMIGMLGGCGMSSQEETLTKEQQDNVVKGIVKNYEIESITFTDLTKDNNTGFYLLSIEINSKRNFSTTLSISQLDELDDPDMDIGLNPIDRFTELERETPLVNNIDISNVQINYLGEGV